MTFRPTCFASSATAAIFGDEPGFGCPGILDVNPSKAQFIWLGTLQLLAKLDLATIAADFPHFIFPSVAQDLGPRASHIHRLCRDSCYQLRLFSTVVRSLTQYATAKLITAQLGGLHVQNQIILIQLGIGNK